MQRPTSVTVFGILNIVFAGFALFGLLATVAVLNAPANTNNPVIKLMHENASYAAWVKVSIPVGLLTAGALLASGIGLLFLKGWARKVSIGYAIFSIGFGILGVVMNFFFLLRPMMEQAKTQSGPEAAGAIGGAIGGTVGGCFGMIYPILLLIFMFRANVVAAFRPATQPPPPPL